jgi:hypothetical protein
MENHPQRPKDCESFEEIIPEDISQMVLNLNEYQPKKVIFEKSPENE